MAFCMESVSVSVIGGGAWGTSLAMHCARKGHDVLLWAREEDVVDSINKEKENHMYFPGHKLPAGLKASSDLKSVAAHGELILLVIPTPFVESVARDIVPVISSKQV